jgi:hypothetical protein
MTQKLLKKEDIRKLTIPQLIDSLRDESEIGSMSEKMYVLPAEQFAGNKEILMQAVTEFRNFVASWDPTQQAAGIAYYQSCFEKIDCAKNDQELSEAVGYLALTIKLD